ncbi:hypothetical protein BK133_06500 [Paenibacillus sp. FSL H8-0548]|uniref:hypothetical protein n=1 Tax=Paenibacillus sp. FSL H8-0548 TaxID=1920422 RepID=UPI00096BD839|nr:hypothetical protein [Paenibacillus sp. FSL H8-0548]OMF37248.1 hypothetical protein BK133_06500 [Paenibacillus sp. FSL H8-0548]
MRLKLILFMIFIVCLLSACKTDVGPTTEDSSSPLSEEMNEVISNYIIEKYSSVYAHTEQQFEVHRVYGTSESNGIISVYMHSYFGGFNKSTGLKTQAGHSLPAVIRLQKKAAGYSVTSYTEPKDGDLYQSSLKKMFPEKYLSMAQRDVGNVEDLHEEMDHKVNVWLGEAK